ncbi:MAG TPA: SusD/RagB family nutrient-binding outer membrane lipoprotein [Cytophagales bacterium]|nr:SusD/RagB family nutrient-binding outer membrane lipoprotein [Cytophagales bacterium]
MKKLLLIIFITGIVFSCNDRLEDINTPDKRASEVPAEPLFANGVREMFDLMTNTDVNINVFRLYAQYWAQTTYPDESQYNMVNRFIPDNFWTNAYRDVLMDLDVARQRVEETAEALDLTEAQKNNQLAIIDVCKVYMFSILVDAFGAVPYSEALNPDILTPKYDAGVDVYNSIIETLNQAIGMMDVESLGFSQNQDIVYPEMDEDNPESVSHWKKFANTLKLRLAINISDVDQGKASVMINEALASGVFTSSEDNAAIPYKLSPPNTNPVWEDLVNSGRHDFVVSNTLIDLMDSTSDPRLSVYAAPTEDEDGNPVFIGGEYGSANAYASYSHVGTLFHQPDLEGILLDYTSIQFWLAEAAAKGIAVPLTAQEYYENGIKASLNYWQITDQAVVDAYMARPEVVYDPVLWKQKIGIQEWLSQYNKPFEGWTTWRRLDFSGFNVPEGLEESDIPRRFIFPVEEATLNPSASQAAAQMIGGDNVQSKVFWDVN